MSKRPLREMFLSFEEGEVPQTFREIAFVAAAGLLETGKALHRIAAVMEREAARKDRHANS